MSIKTFLRTRTQNLLKNKKGIELQSFLLIEILLGLIVAGILVFTMTNPYVSKAEEYYTNYDIKLLSEAIASAPGDIEYNYETKTDYSIEAKDGLLVVKKTGAKYEKHVFVFEKEDNNIKIAKKV